MTSLFSKKNIIWVVFLIVTYFLVAFLIDVRIITPYYRSILFWVGIYVILGVSLNIIIGIAGQLSLGHAGFMSIGAYATAITLRYNPTLLGLFMGMGIGFVISLVVSFIVAMPTLRLKGDYLAIATLGVGEIIRIIILNMEITDGARGISNIPNLISWPMLFFFVVTMVILAANFKNSAQGRACVAIKDDEIASE
jgi:branched-chain amino acid transport system permease protein